MARRRRTLNSKVAEVVGRGILLRGFRAHKRGWLTISLALSGLRLFRRAFGRTEQIAATEVISLGQVLRLEVIQRPPSQSRRAARRAR